MGMFGIGGKKPDKKETDATGFTEEQKKPGKKETDATGFTEEQKKAQKTGEKVKAISAIARRRKAMAEILGK